MGGINPSMQYSKNMIIDSLLAYMEYRAFSDIKITEVVKKAGVSRKTFYRHFSSKKDVLDTYLDCIFQEYLEREEEGYSYEEVIIIFFEVMKEHINFFQLIYTHELSNVAIKRLEFFLSVLNQKPKYKKMEKPIVAYCETFSASSLWKILHMWIDNGLRETPKEITDIYLILSK